MVEAKDVKETIKKSYGDIARENKAGGSCCGTTDIAFMAEDYSQLDGYQKDADLGLGCGIPTEIAKIKQGDTVIDLGSGAGNDCFVARHETGPEGKVIGIDFTPAMIKKARENVEK
ncbi:MAG: methyltransferase domain-containing protein, partial [Calditrichaeota bacterium]|nr:methyltransferase domain-containing protein [Calditrichota bacterium]